MKHFYYLLLAFFVLSLAAAAADKPVPKFNGKPLSYWMDRLEKAESDKEQREVAEVIQEFGIDAAPVLPKLIEMLDDRSAGYRAIVCNVLIGIGPGAKAAVPALMQMLKDKTARDPGRIIEVLVKIGPDAKDFVPILITALENPDTAREASTALGNLGAAAKEGIPALIKLIEKSSLEGWIADSAITALGNLGAAAKDAVPALTKSLEIPQLTRTAVSALLEIGPDAKDALPAIRRALRDAKLRIRRASKDETDANLFEPLRRLYQLGPAAIPVLTEFLSDDVEMDRTHISFEWANGTRHEVATNAGCQSSAAVALGNIGPEAKQTIPILRKLLKSKDPLLQRRVAEALWKIEKDATVVSVLIPFVERLDSFWSEKRGEIGPEARAALPALKKAVESNEGKPNPFVLQEAIKKIEGEPKQKE